MSGARGSGYREDAPEPAAAAADPALADAGRIQRRRHAWALAMFWLIAACLLCLGINSSANSNGTPSPSWFIDGTIALGVVAVAALVVVLGYSAAMHGRPAEVRAQAVLLERQRLRGVWRGRPGHV